MLCFAPVFCLVNADVVYVLPAGHHLWLGIESVEVDMSGVKGSVRGVPGRVMDLESAGVASVDRFRAMWARMRCLRGGEHREDVQRTTTLTSCRINSPS